MHLLVELLFPLLFTLTRVFLAVWTDLPILSPSILRKQISDNTQQRTNCIYPGSREAEGKLSDGQKPSSQKTFSNIFSFDILAPLLSMASSTHTEDVVSLYLTPVSSEFGLRCCLQAQPVRLHASSLIKLHTCLCGRNCHSITLSLPDLLT